MQLTVDLIKKSGGFSGGLVKKTVKWSNEGEDFEADVFVRPMSYQTSVGDAEAIRAGDDFLANRIAKHICDAEGFPVFQLSDITGFDKEGSPIMTTNEAGEEEERGALNKGLADALIEIIHEVSGVGKTRPPLGERKSSGTS